MLNLYDRSTLIARIHDQLWIVIPAEACYLGWQESLALLKLLVEAKIPDQM
jgi:hypothetical protein